MKYFLSLLRWERPTPTLADILKQQRKLMATFVEVQTAVTKLDGDVTAAIAAATADGATPAQLDTLLTQVQAIDTRITTPAA